MQNIKYFFIIGIFLFSILFLTGCFEQKKDLTSDEFISIASKYGYKTFDELGKSFDMDNVDVEALKNKFDDFFYFEKCKSKTQLIDMNFSNNVKSSSIVFVEFEDEKHAKLAIGCWDDLRIKKGFGQLPLKQDDSSITNFEEFSVGRANRVVITGTVSNFCNIFGEQKMYIIYSKVKNNLIQIIHIGEGKKDIDNMLNELGF